MDIRKTRNFAILACSSALLTAAVGCSSRVPVRHAPVDRLVRSGEFDGSDFVGRRDATLGADRAAFVRTVTGSSESTFDRQRIIDGRPYADFRVTTRTRSAIAR